jgi:tRNA (cmo5U34)-methyltransferase
MDQDQLKALFDQQAANYDQQWERTAPIRNGLHFVLDAVLADLPTNAHALGVGVGTGAELAYLAQKFPQWRFTAVEPSAAMLEVCRARAEREGFADRCSFHEGYVDDLPSEPMFDAATCFLVSQFILDRAARMQFFRSLAQRLRPGGILASSDLASPVNSQGEFTLLPSWLTLMAGSGVTSEHLARMRAAYAKDVAILPPASVAEIIQAGGFAQPTIFFQAGMIHAWFSRRQDD